MDADSFPFSKSTSGRGEVPCRFYTQFLDWDISVHDGGISERANPSQLLPFLARIQRSPGLAAFHHLFGKLPERASRVCAVRQDLAYAQKIFVK